MALKYVCVGPAVVNVVSAARLMRIKSNEWKDIKGKTWTGSCLLTPTEWCRKKHLRRLRDEVYLDFGVISRADSFPSFDFPWSAVEVLPVGVEAKLFLYKDEEKNKGGFFCV